METRKYERLDGTFALAAKAGVSPCHVWMVRTGRRHGSKRVRDALEAAGVRLPRRRGGRKGGAR